MRPCHFARRAAESFAVVLDPRGKLHWDGGELDGDHLVMVLTEDVPDSHLCELTGRGVSYIIAGKGSDIDLHKLLDVLAEDLGLATVLVEGGGVVNGRFLSEGLIDEISLVVYPAIDGRSGTHTIFEGGEDGLADKVELSFINCRALRGGAVQLHYKRRSSPAAL